MSHTHVSNRLHCVFSTKDRKPFFDEELQPRLWSYVGGIAHNLDIEIIAIGGSCDHMHMLIALPAKFALAEAMQKIKANSSRWLTQVIGTRGFAWQEGYGAFSVSISQTDATVTYIHAQPEHHRKRDYAEEFRKMLAMHGISLPS
jgi:putative transposase